MFASLFIKSLNKNKVFLINQKSNCMKYSLLTLFVCLIMSCGSESSSPNGSGEMVDLAELREEIATNITDNFILPSFQELTQKSVSLNQAAISFRDNTDESNLDDLRTKHQALWTCWQKTSLYFFGPTVDNGLRTSLNTYPTDEDKIENNILTGIFQIGSLGNQDAEGLPALDYLLNGVDDPAPLSFFSEERLEYINILTTTIQDNVANTVEDWNNGEFIENFTGSNANGTDVGSALGLIVNGIDIHFQRFVRDGKVAIPSGIRTAGVVRPGTVEVRFGRYSTSLLETSIIAYQNYFNGNGGPSILEYLREIDQPELADRIDTHFTIILEKVELLDPSIAQQTETDNEALIDLFLSLQDLVTIFKSDMASVMGISITNQDNDGD